MFPCSSQISKSLVSQLDLVTTLPIGLPVVKRVIMARCDIKIVLILMEIFAYSLKSDLNCHLTYLRRNQAFKDSSSRFIFKFNFEYFFTPQVKDLKKRVSDCFSFVPEICKQSTYECHAKTYWSRVFAWPNHFSEPR